MRSQLLPLLLQSSLPNAWYGSRECSVPCRSLGYCSKGLCLLLFLKKERNLAGTIMVLHRRKSDRAYTVSPVLMDVYTCLAFFLFNDSVHPRLSLPPPSNPGPPPPQRVGQRAPPSSGYLASGNWVSRLESERGGVDRVTRQT